jgi:hypothetical protein
MVKVHRRPSQLTSAMPTAHRKWLKETSYKQRWAKSEFSERKQFTVTLGRTQKVSGISLPCLIPSLFFMSTITRASTVDPIVN